MVLLMDELLHHRRHYFARTLPRDANRSFNDVDYAIARYLLTRLNVRSVKMDDTSLGQQLFHDLEFDSESHLFRVREPGDEEGDLPSGEAAGFSALNLFCPVSRPDAAWLSEAAASTSLCMCYGVRGPLDGEFWDFLGQLAPGPEEPLMVPLFGLAPGLWRCASFLVVRRSRRAVLMDAIRHLVAAFSCDDLDALKLAEENLKLRETIQGFSAPGTSQAEIDKLKSAILVLEREIVALRRAALQQEKDIAAKSHP
jgi:hypothetical protein